MLLEEGRLADLSFLDHATENRMGLEDPAAASLEASFLQIERAILQLISDAPAPEVSPPVTSPLTLDMYNYFAQLHSNINEAKCKFQELYKNLDRRIHELCEQLRKSVNGREQELKHQLRCIKNEKRSKWNTQLRLCEEKLSQLQQPSTSRATETSADRTILDFVDSGELKLNVDNFRYILKELQSFSKFTFPRKSRWKDVHLQNTTPKFTFGAAGDGPGQFCRPWGVCSDYLGGRILVCDRSNHRIQIFTANGEFITQFGREGRLPGEFFLPSGIDVNADGEIIVADKDNHRVQVFTNSGRFMHLFGSQGSRPGQFQYPWDVATNAERNIAVSDSQNHRVQLFHRKGHLLLVFDASVMGIKNSQLRLKFLDSPRGLAFRPDGALLVTDFNNHKLLLIHPDFKRTSTLGSAGVSPGDFYRPQGVACDRSGKVAVADGKNYRIQIFDELGNLIKVFGSQGTRPGEFDYPQGVCFHPNSSIVVVDFRNNRIQIF